MPPRSEVWIQVELKLNEKLKLIERAVRLEVKLSKLVSFVRLVTVSFARFVSCSWEHWLPGRDRHYFAFADRCLVAGLSF
jgi:hypothetical protein